MNTKIINIHYGELALKKGNRSYFEKLLASNLKAKLGGMGICTVRRLPGRIIIEFAEPVSWSAITDKIKKVFGFAVAYPVERTAVTLADLEKAVLAGVDDIEFKTFGVRTKRANKKFELTSPELSRQLGSSVYIKTGADVNLTNPDLWINVEVLDNDIYYSFTRMKGPGGLPTGVSGHVLSLLSGGIDSPVAAWMMMKRGIKNSFLHFHSAPFTDEASVEKVEDMALMLSEWQGSAKLFIIPFGELQKKIVTTVESKYRVLIYRRFMLRIALKVAKRARAEAIVTGEALGQVASQTMSNMASVEAIADLPVMRPLIGMDKQEIVDIAKKIGTYELSIQPHQDCCSFLQPSNPATKSTVEELNEVESAFDVEKIVQDVLEGMIVKKFGSN